ncbi:hypothetical protein K1719_008794 [Acacia pycnantha]|nr:hypothetical protein K1719_008794 [Acacia pycnantha]
MMYLFLMQPDMLSELHGIEGPWTQETMVDGSISREFIDFFKQNGLTSRNDEEEACQCILSRPHHYNSPPYPTVLLLERSMAQDLKEFPSYFKWEAITDIWVEMLIFAAIHCRSSIHFKRLPEGGELISHVWLASSSRESDVRLQRERAYARPQILIAVRARILIMKLR